MLRKLLLLSILLFISKSCIITNPFVIINKVPNKVDSLYTSYSTRSVNLHPLQNQLRNRWEHTAKAKLKDVSDTVGITSESLNLLKDLIAEGANKIIHDGANNERLLIAEKNLIVFIDTLITEAKLERLAITPKRIISEENPIKTKSSEKRYQISEETFAKVKYSLCSIYPFC